MNKDKKAQRAIEETDTPPTGDDHHPAAGPHAKEHLTDGDKTPGTGILPDDGETTVSPGSG